MSAFVSHKFKLIFPHVPRTGGTSLYETVLPQLGPSDITDGQLEKHQSMRIIKIGHPKEFEAYTKFAVIRDPFDRLVSLHQGYSPKCSLKSIVAQLDAEARSGGVRDAFFWPAKRWLCDETGAMMADTVFRLEDGFKDVIGFLEDRGLKIKAFPHLNRGPEAQKGGYYDRARKECDPETMETIKRLYAWDYDLWRSLGA